MKIRYNNMVSIDDLSDTRAGPSAAASPSAAADFAMTGGCLCGHVRYALKKSPNEGLICHCRMCQRAGGAFAVAWASVASIDFQLTAGGLNYIHSSVAAQRGFCGDCGSPISFSAKVKGIEDFGVTVASLDAPDAVSLSAHIWTSSQRRGYLPFSHLPAYAEETPTFKKGLGTRHNDNGLFGL